MSFDNANELASSKIAKRFSHTDTDHYIQNIKEQIRNTPYDDLQEKIYICFANGCLLLTSFLQKKGQSGWASGLVSETGEPILTHKEQETVEALFASAPWIWDMLSTVKQKGGAGEIPQFQPASKLVEATSLTGDDVSLDKMFNSFLKKTNEIDDYWTKFARNSPGFARKLNSEVQVGQFSVPTKPLVLFLITLIDSFRLSAALAGSQSYLLTLLVLIEELITGQWRQMLITATGFISPTGTAISVLFKYIVNAWMLINPSLRDQILHDAYKGSKSLLIGFLLWASTTFTPMVVKAPIQMALNDMREMLKGLEDKLKSIEEKGSEKLAPFGKRLVFTQANFSKISEISLEDIQNLQTLAQWDFINCTAEFQAILEPLKEFPPFRLLIELLGVPVTVQQKLEVCRIPEPYPSITQTVQAKLTPSVVNLENKPIEKNVKSTEEETMPAAPTEKNITVKGGAKTRHASKTKGKRMTRRIKITKLT